MAKEKKNAGGRPSKVKSLLKHPLANSLLKELAQRNATDAECAARMLTALRTWCRWKALNKEFWQSLSAKPELDDASVELALLESARGFTKVITKVVGDVTEVEERYYPPNVAATAFYLKNRKPHQWRDKIDISASMEQIPVRINFKRKEKVIETEGKIISEPLAVESTVTEQTEEASSGESGDPDNL